MTKINIITQLMVFFIFSVALNLLNLKALLLAAAIVLVMLALVKNHHFYRLSKRLKWFYLVMFVIFAFNTPGEHVAGWPFAVSPTYEGLHAGFMQLLRITVMLAALSLLLASNTRQQLISGFYFLFSPLKYIGLDVERFAARLWLTLHYVELQQQTPKSQHIFSHLNQKLSSIFTETQHDDITITLEKPMFAWADYTLMALMFVLLIQILFRVAV